MKILSFRMFQAVVLIYLFALPVFSQVTWQRTYGGSRDDYGYSVQQTPDGGYIVAGYTNSSGAGGFDVYLIKADASGNAQWTKTYGGSRNDYGVSVQQTSDGGYIIAGETYSFGAYPYSDVYLIKTNSGGDTLWTKTHGGANFDGGRSVQQTSDGGYIIAGYTLSFGAGGSDVYLIKTDASGNIQWTRAFGGSNTDDSWSVQQTSDGGYVIAGYTFSYPIIPDSSLVYVIKTDASGDTLWTRTYGGTNNYYGYSIQQTSDGHCIVAGYTTYSARQDGKEVYAVKIYPSGDIQWLMTYGGWYNDYGRSVRQTSDGGYVIAGYSNSYSAGDYDVYLIKTDDGGYVQWINTYGGGGDDGGESVKQTLDGGYIITGYTNSLGAGGYDVYLIKTDENGNIGVEVSEAPPSVSPFQFRVTPNPFIMFANIPGHQREFFTLYDITGRKIGMCRGDRIGADIRPGVYFLRGMGENSKPLRIVKVK